MENLPERDIRYKASNYFTEPKLIIIENVNKNYSLNNEPKRYYLRFSNGFTKNKEPLYYLMSYNENENKFNKCKAINTSGRLVDIIPNKTFRNSLWIIKDDNTNKFNFKEPNRKQIALLSYGYTDKNKSKFYFTQEYNIYGKSTETLKIHNDISNKDNKTWIYNSV